MLRLTYLVRLLLALFVLMASAPAFAAPPSAPVVLINMDIGYGGYTKQDNWTPVRVTLTSNESVEGDLVLTDSSSSFLGASGGLPDQDRMLATVRLSREARRQVTLYAKPNVASFDLKFIAGKNEIATTNGSVRQLTNLDRLTIVVSEPLDAFNFLGEQNTPFGGKNFVAQMRPDQLPDRIAALAACDVILINNVDTSQLRESQRAALRAWVLSGGHLILNGGSGARLANIGLADLAAARVSPTTIASDRLMSSLREFASVIRTEPLTVITPTQPTAPLAALQLTTNDGVVMLSSVETPLIVRRSIGQGIVDQLAFDASLSPISSWRDRVHVFSVLFNGRLDMPNIVGPLRAELSASAAARSIPSTKLPSSLWILAFVLLYILTLGPLTFFVLRRLKRLMLAWVALPLVIGAFTLMGALLSVQVRGAQTVMQQISAVFGDSRFTDANKLGVVGMLSPRRNVIDVDLERALPQALRDSPESQRPNFGISVRQSDSNQLDDLVVAPTEVRTLYLRGEGSIPKIDAEIKVVLARAPSETSKLVGTLRNASSVDFVDCVFSSGNDWKTFAGAFTPGAAINFELPLTKPQLRALIAPKIGRYSATSSFSTTSFLFTSRSIFVSSEKLDAFLLEWRNYAPSASQVVGARRIDQDLLESVFMHENMTLGNTASLACWELGSTPSSTRATSYIDRGLRVWSLPVESVLVATGTPMSAAFFNWSVTNSTSSVSVADNGLTLDSGKHYFSVTPWLGVRNSTETQKVTTRLEFPSTIRGLNLRDISLWMFNWKTKQYDRVRASLNSRVETIEANGAYFSPIGEVRLMLQNASNDAITMGDLRVDVLAQ